MALAGSCVICRLPPHSQRLNTHLRIGLPNALFLPPFGSLRSSIKAQEHRLIQGKFISFYRLSTSNHDRKESRQVLTHAGESGTDSGLDAVAVPMNVQPMSVLDRYLFGELLLPLLLGLAAFSFLAISIGSWHEVSLVLRQGALRRAAAVLALRIPAFVGLAIPMAALLAPLLGFNQLRLSGETIALQACGVRKRRMVRLAGVLFLGVAVFHLALAEIVAPTSNRIATDIVAEARAVSASPTIPAAQRLRWGPVLHLDIRGGSLRRLLYAQAGDGTVLLRPAVIHVQHSSGQSFQDTLDESSLSEDRSPSARELARIRNRGRWPGTIMTADAAWWDSRVPGWRLRDGKEHELIVATNQEAQEPTEHKEVMNCNVKSQETQNWPGRQEVEALRMHVGRSTDDLSVKQMNDMLEALRVSKISKERRTIQLKLQQRIALPFASLVFGVLAASLSFHLPLQNRLAGLSLTLGLVFMYYMLSVTGSLLSQLMLLPPVVGAWLPNFVGALVALALIIAP